MVWPPTAEDHRRAIDAGALMPRGCQPDQPRTVVPCAHQSGSQHPIRAYEYPLIRVAHRPWQALPKETDANRDIRLASYPAELRDSSTIQPGLELDPRILDRAAE